MEGAAASKEALKRDQSGSRGPKHPRLTSRQAAKGPRLLLAAELADLAQGHHAHGPPAPFSRVELDQGAFVQRGQGADGSGDKASDTSNRTAMRKVLMIGRVEDTDEAERVGGGAGADR